MPRKRSNELDDDELPILSLTELYIIVAFGDEERHGYGIMQQVESDSRGALRLRPSTVYCAINRMLEAGYLEHIERVPKPPPSTAEWRAARMPRAARWKEDCRRRYYALTPHGRTVAELQLQHLEALLKRARARQVLRDLFAARAAKAAEQPGTR